MDTLCDPISATVMTEWMTDFSLPASAPMRLFCFPYAGGGAGVFRPWANYFLNRVKVQALQLPGREQRLSDSSRVDTLTELIDLIAPAFEDLDVPFAFFGHSMGGLIAFELTRELRRRGWPTPGILFASACCAPQIPDYVVPPRSTLSDQALAAELRRLNGTDEAIIRNEALLSLLLPALRADFNIVDGYRYCDEPPLDSPIIALGGLHDTEVGVDKLTGWQLQTTRGFDVQMFNGDHFYLNNCRNALLKTIQDGLARWNHAGTRTA